MGPDDAAYRRAFFALHDDLPREGQGNRESTARALALAGALPARARVLDIACGPGAQTLDLASLLPEAEIPTLDNHAPFLAALARRAAAAGVAERVHPVQGDMAARLEALGLRYAGGPVGEAVLGECREEIAVRREFAGWYGYVFLVVRADAAG